MDSASTLPSFAHRFRGHGKAFRRGASDTLSRNEEELPVGSYHVVLGTLYFGLGNLRPKSWIPQKGVWYEPTGTVEASRFTMLPYCRVARSACLGDSETLKPHWGLLDCLGGYVRLLRSLGSLGWGGLLSLEGAPTL